MKASTKAKSKPKHKPQPKRYYALFRAFGADALRLVHPILGEMPLRRFEGAGIVAVIPLFESREDAEKWKLAETDVIQELHVVVNKA